MQMTNVLPGFMWVPSGVSGFHSPAKNKPGGGLETTVGLQKFAPGVNVSLHNFLCSSVLRFPMAH